MPRLKTEVVLQIKKDLKQGWETQVELAHKYGVTPHTIKNINRGLSYFDSGEEYPLRQQRRSPKKLESINVPPRKARAINITNELMYNLDKSMRDIAKEYDVSYSTVTRINSGERNRDEDLTYPLRVTGVEIGRQVRRDAGNGMSIIELQNKYLLTYKEVKDYLRGIDNGKK